jgi:hypothetical protein
MSTQATEAIAEQPLELQPTKAASTSEVIEASAAGGELAELSAIEKAVTKLFNSDGRAEKAQKTCDAALAKLPALDLKTKKGLDEAISLKTSVLKERTGADKDSKAIKKRLSDLGKAIGAESDKIAAITEPVEKKLETVIEARKVEQAAEKAEAERINQERLLAHQAKLDQLRAMLPAQAVALAAGPEKIAQQIERVESVPISPELWEEFAVSAQVEKTQILAHLRAWHDLALAQVAQERQRIQMERMGRLTALSQMAMQAFGKTAAEIRTVAQEVEAAGTEEADWGELLTQAQMAKTQSLGMLGQLLAQAEKVEAAKAEAEAAAAAEAAKAVEEAAAAEADKAAAEKAAAAEAADAAQVAEEAKTTAVATTPETATEAVAVVSAPMLIAAAPAQEPAMDEARTAPVAEPLTTDPATVVPASASAADEFIKLGEFNLALAVCSVDAEQLAALGFQHQSVPGLKGKCYPKDQRVAMAHALINGIHRAIARWEQGDAIGTSGTSRQHDVHA